MALNPFGSDSDFPCLMLIRVNGLSEVFTYTTYTLLTLCKLLIITLLQASVSSVSKNKTLLGLLF